MKKVRIISGLLILLISIEIFTQDNPNVLFIAIDDLNDFVGCMNGSIKAHTPNIDRLAKSGALFTNAHCQAPICAPSRASVMTGLYPSTSGNYIQLNDKDIKGSNDITAKSVFMPDYFENHGYKTLAVGKVFHGGNAPKAFQEYGGRFAWMGPKPDKRVNYNPKAWPNKTGGTKTDWGAYPEHDSMMTDFKSAKWATSKLQEEHDKPFFMAVGFVRPHVPWFVPQKWFDMFPVDKISTPPYKPDDMDDIPEMGKRVANVPMMPTTEEMIEANQWKDILQAYLACIAFVDEQVGKVIDALEKSKYKDNTIIVLWSDHGYHLGEKNRFAKHAIWERDTRTVLIFKTPEMKKGTKCNAPSQLVDIYPTLLELCDLPEYDIADGNSLVPYLKKPELKGTSPALSFYGVANVVVRTEQYRLIQYEDGSQEFYDMVKDPNEWYNLANDPNLQDEIKKMQKHIPEKWAALSKFSKYKMNEYFYEKLNELKE